MRNKEAIKTYNENQNRLALRRRRALGSRKIKVGNYYVELPCASKVIYCSACKGPVIDDEVGRRRHAMKSAACKAAMGI